MYPTRNKEGELTVVVENLKIKMSGRVPMKLFCDRSNTVKLKV